MKTFTEFNYCAETFSTVNNKCKLHLFDETVVVIPKKCNKHTKIRGCSDSAKLNLRVEDYSMGMSFSAITIGLVFSFTMLLLISQISRK